MCGGSSSLVLRLLLLLLLDLSTGLVLNDNGKSLRSMNVLRTSVLMQQRSSPLHCALAAGETNLKEWIISTGICERHADRVLQICDQEMIGSVRNLETARAAGLLPTLFKPLVAISIEKALLDARTSSHGVIPASAARSVHSAPSMLTQVTTAVEVSTASAGSRDVLTAKQAFGGPPAPPASAFSISTQNAVNTTITRVAPAFDAKDSASSEMSSSVGKAPLPNALALQWLEAEFGKDWVNATATSQTLQKIRSTGENPSTGDIIAGGIVTAMLAATMAKPLLLKASLGWFLGL
mmetsp:Transcript_0/g.1  ORF Transcript_0/g.1 Transcript_0/m.1 type:complete len:294 (+) Transcript_0:85-966(+)